MASNKRLNATITIGGAVTGSLQSALGGTKSKLLEIGGAIAEVKKRQKELSSVMADQERLGTAGSAMKVRYAQQELADTNKQLDALRKKQDLLKRETQLGQTLADMRTKMRGGMIGLTAGGIATLATLGAPLKAFKDLDEAMNNMQIAMMDKSGGLPELFGEIKKQTIELGNILPGTTADFVNLATALKEGGTPLDIIAGGALKSGAHLAVVLKMVPEQAGEMVAKLRQAFQLSAHEFDKMADYTQRARFGFGLKSDDLLLGAKYYGGKLNALGIIGAENVRRIYAIQGMASQQGMDGSTFGTNFSMMLTRVGLMTERLHKNSKEMRAVNAELHKAGIQMTFFDKAGKFAGVENMVAQLGKLSKLSQEKRLQVLTRIFGEEGGRVADLIARNGIGGYEKALEKIDNEASLDQRISMALTSFKNQLEALTGTFTNLLAAIGEPIAQLFSPVMKQLNEIIGGPMQAWVEQNKALVGIVGGIVAAGGGLMLIGAAIAAIGWASTFAIGGLVALSGILGAITTVVGGALATVGLPIILAIAAAGLLIWKFWEPISSLFSGLWDGFMEGAQNLLPIIQAMIEPIKSLVGWFGDLLAPVDKASGAVQLFGSIGKMVGRGIAAAFELILTPLGMISTMLQYLWNTLGLGRLISAIKDAGGGAVSSPSSSPAVALPDAPAAAQRGGVTVHDSSTTTIQVAQQPGQSSTELADEILRQMQAREQTQRRGWLYDYAMP